MSIRQICPNCKMAITGPTHWEPATVDTAGFFKCIAKRVGPVRGLYQPEDSATLEYMYDGLWRDKQGWYHRCEDESRMGPFGSSLDALMHAQDYFDYIHR